MRSIVIACIASTAIMGCAQKSEKIEASYIPSATYNSFSCSQIEAEARNVTKRANVVAGLQDQKASDDAATTGVAIVLFWPAAFFIKGDTDTAAEVANLKGQLDALERASNQKNCQVVFEKVTAVKPAKDAANDSDAQISESTVGPARR